jgi:RNA polymerase sigma factor (sigma-70 family)
MSARDSTCWTLLREAAAGNERPRAEFVMRYEPVVRAYLAARWRGSGFIQELDDAAQECFVECLRQGGVLARAQAGQLGGFRAFLFGAVRNVAMRFEKRRARDEARGAIALESIASDEDSLSRVFDRAWATAIVREAAARQAEMARGRGAAAIRRVELLRLRFQEELPIREIARVWGEDAAVVHHEYARARQEFLTALRDVIASQHPDAPEHIDRECAQILSLFS